jgi:NO-binding membrane sensor protein with MHYT domain
VITRFRALLELVLACAALVGVAVCWVHARHLVTVGPITDGQPSTTSLVYNPQLLLLAMLLAMIAGVLAVLGTARLRRSRVATPTF